MRYKNRNIDDFLKNKNWDGVKRFTDRYSIGLLIMLDNIVATKDFEALKDFVQTYSIQPLLEYGLPVEGKGIKELYDISDRYHSHKYKIGAEWWVRDEVEDLMRQLKGHLGEHEILDRISLIWKEVDEVISAEPWLKERAFKKILMKSLIIGIYKAEIGEETDIMDQMDKIFEKSGFSMALKYNEDFVE